VLEATSGPVEVSLAVEDEAQLKVGVHLAVRMSNLLSDVDGLISSG
jgi:hypothetical protein